MSPVIHRTIAGVVMTIAVFSSLAAAQDPAAASPAAPLKAPPTPDSLAAITVRGQLLAQYDYVAWHASDSVAARKPAPGLVQGYVAREHETGNRWDVAFGRPSANRDTFYVAYLVQQQQDDPNAFDVFTYTPAMPDTGYFARAHRAIAVATADFGAQSRPYNPAVIERPNGMLWVYLMPAQVDARVFPLGGDVRYLFPADGKAFVAKRKLHNSIIEFSAQAGMAAGMHTAVLDDIPEDTDVYHVLARRPSLPEYIATDAFNYVIAPNGAIKLMGRRKP